MDELQTIEVSTPTDYAALKGLVYERDVLRARVAELEALASVVKVARERVRQIAPGVPWCVELPMTDDEYHAFNSALR